METGDWRTQLHPSFRNNVINEIAGEMKEHIPNSSSEEELSHLQTIAEKFEEKTYTIATSESNYYQIIYSKICGMRIKREVHSFIPSKNIRGNSNNSLDQGKLSTTKELIKVNALEVNIIENKANGFNLFEEIEKINQRLIDTVVEISNEDLDPTPASEACKGTIVKCSYTAVALCRSLKSLYASGQIPHIEPLRFLVPSSYPSFPPILLDKFPNEVSKESEDFSAKVRTRFIISVRSLSKPTSVWDMARTWDVCLRAVISEYAQQRGGGTFSSKFGAWENC